MAAHHDFYRGKRVLITGGMGFLGSHLAIALVENGARVSILDAMLPVFGGNEFNLQPVRDRVEVRIADIRDERAVGEMVADQDLLFHIGMQTSHVDSMNDPLWDIDINCRGTMIVYEAVRRNAPDCHVIYAGTRGQYGILRESPVDEDHPMSPTDIYGVDKVAAELYGFVYSRAHGIRFTSLRISNSYGPRHQMKHGKYGILNWFLRLAMDDETISLYGGGEQKRDYNFVDDVTEAFLLCGAMPEATVGRAFHLGGGRPLSLRAATELVIEAAGSGRYEITPWPGDREAIETGDFVADTSRFREATGWQPRIEMEEGLARSVEYYRRHREHYW
jgi:UDP-glucose 4-epimerase